MEQKTKKIQITLSQDEYETLLKFSELQGRPLATLFVEFCREVSLFSTLKKVIRLAQTMKKVKSDFRNSPDLGGDLATSLLDK